MATRDESKMRVVHLRSNIDGKLPTSDGTLSGTPLVEYGEIAVNYAEKNEFLSIRNSNNEVVQFKTWDATTEALNSLEKEMIDNEQVVAEAITQLVESVGLGVDMEYQPKEDAVTVADALSITDAIDKLDKAVSSIDNTLFVIPENGQLPTSNIKENKIYLIPNSETGNQDSYIEYVYANGQWEKFGEFKTDLDLTVYAKQSGLTAVETTVNEHTSQISNINTTLSGKAEQSALNELSGTVASKVNQSEFDTLEEVVGGHTNSIAAINKDIADHAQEFGELEVVVGRKADLSGLTVVETAVSTNTSKIGELNEELELTKNRVFIGTQEEYDTAYAANKIPVGALVIILGDGENEEDTIALLGTAILGKMVLGTN